MSQGTCFLMYVSKSREISVIHPSMRQNPGKFGQWVTKKIRGILVSSRTYILVGFQGSYHALGCATDLTQICRDCPITQFWHLVTPWRSWQSFATSWAKAEPRRNRRFLHTWLVQYNHSCFAVWGLWLAKLWISYAVFLDMVLTHSLWPSRYATASAHFDYLLHRRDSQFFQSGSTSISMPIIILKICDSFPNGPFTEWMYWPATWRGMWCQFSIQNWCWSLRAMLHARRR
jgi:hypothetical protein